MEKLVFVSSPLTRGKFSWEKKVAKTAGVKVAPRKMWKSNKKVNNSKSREKVQIR